MYPLASFPEVARRKARLTQALALLLTAASAILGMQLGACSSDDSSGGSEKGDAGKTPAADDKALLYSTVYADNELAVIDDDTFDIVDHIKVGQGPAILLETPDHRKLYTANWSDNTISAITVATHKIKSIPLTQRAYVIAISPDGKTLYAGLNANSISVIDTASDTVTRSLNTSSTPVSVVVSADNATLYVAHLAGTLEALDAESGDVTHAAISVGTIPAWITITPDGKTVYSLNFTSNNVSAVDTATFKVTHTISTGAGSEPIIGAVTPDGSALYVTNFGSSDLSVIDTSTNLVMRTQKLKGRPVGIGFSVDGKRGYVTDFGDESLNASPLSMLSVITSGQIMTTGDGRVTVFATETGETIAETMTGGGPTSVIDQPAK